MNLQCLAIDKFHLLWLLIFVGTVFVGACADPTQSVDLTANVKVRRPTFSSEQSPLIVIDAAHANFHTASGRYQPLANLLLNDGYTIEENHELLSDTSFIATDVFVIANADFKASGISFRPNEIIALKNYVLEGGSLLLIADHTPFPAAIEELASAFSIQFFDVYADDGQGIFSKKNGGLSSDPLLDGIDQVRTFGGSAFKIDTNASRPLLLLGPEWMMQTMEANGLSEKKSANGLLQGAVLPYGKGKVAVFGEAAMFSAQTYGRWKKRMGFHARGAEDNKQFILNLFHYLAQ